jgi:hypothetical protein
VAVHNSREVVRGGPISKRDVRFGGRGGARVTVKAHHSEAGGPIDRLDQTDDTTVATEQQVS